MNLRLPCVIAGLAMLLTASRVSASAPDPFAEGAPPQKAAQQAVAVADLPAAVTASIEKAYPGSTIVSAAKVSRGTQVRFELSVKPTADAAPIAVMVSPEGVMKTSAKGAPPAGKGARKAGAAAAAQPFPVADLPKPVVKAIKDAYPKDVITAALKSSSGAHVSYQLTLNDVSSVAPLHVTVTSEGQIQKR